MKKVLSIIIAIMLIITSFTIPASAYRYDPLCPDEIEYEVYNEDFLYLVLSDNTVCLEGYVGNDSDVTIPSSINGMQVTEIGTCAFENNETLTNVTIPYGVKIIGHAAFRECISLKSVSTPDSVVEIKNNAFTKCYSLESVKLSNNLTTISHQTFWDCKSLTAIEIPENVKNIGNYAFGGCNSLESIAIPDLVTSIKDNTFFGCTSLKSVTIPESVTSFGNNVFASHSDDLVIYGYTDSTAQTYAKENDINFVSLGYATTIVIGDVDGDGKITIMDTSMVQRSIAQYITLTDIQTIAADTDKDGKIAVMDATAIQRFIAGLITEF